jgi:Ca2+/Na+ antiporter
MVIAAIILLPLLLGIMFLVSGFLLNSDEHKVMRIFLFLLSIPSFLTSLHFGLISIVKFYDFPELQDAVGSTTYWVGLVFFAIISYFIIYLFHWIVNVAAQRKKEKLEY